jgi:hypothetical protein
MRTVFLLALLTAGCTAGPYFAPEMIEFGPPQDVFQPLGEGTWETVFRERGFVLRDGDEWRMWYTGTACKSCPGKLGYATSSDGLAFHRYSDAPIFEDAWIEDTQVIHDGTNWYIFAEGLDDVMQMLTSDDGIHWKRVGRVDIRYKDGTPLTHGPSGTPVVLHEDGVWYLLYERLDDGIWLAKSTDLVTFTNVDDMPVIPIGPAVTDAVRISLNQVVRHEGRYYAYYNGQGQLPEWSIHVAVSDDLIHWEKYPNNPITRPEDNEASNVLIHDGDRWRMYTMDHHVRVHFGH